MDNVAQQPDGPDESEDQNNLAEGDLDKIHIQALERATAILAEHFDTVQIFVTRHENDGTLGLKHSHGNYYARLGQVKDWLIQQEQGSRNQVE